MHRLKMPEPLARAGVEREERVREQVCANAVATIEVRGRGTRRHVDDAARRVHGHAGPRVRAADRLPRTRGPSVVPEFAGPWNRVKGPANRSGVNVVCTHVTCCRALALANARTLDEEILVDHARARGDQILAGDVATESRGEIE